MKSTGELRLYPGNGNGRFKTMKRIGTGWQGMKNLALANTAEGPGIYGTSRGTLLFYPAQGNSGGGFKARKDVASGWGNVSSIIAVGDWTGDRQPDLLTTDAAGILYLHKGGKTATPGARVQVGHGWANMRIVGAANQKTAKGPIWAVDKNGKLLSYRVR